MFLGHYGLAFAAKRAAPPRDFIGSLLVVTVGSLLRHFLGP